MELTQDEIQERYGLRAYGYTWKFHHTTGEITGRNASLTVDDPDKIRELADQDMQLTAFAPLVSLPAAIEACKNGAFDDI